VGGGGASKSMNHISVNIYLPPPTPTHKQAACRLLQRKFSKMAFYPSIKKNFDEVEIYWRKQGTEKQPTAAAFINLHISPRWNGKAKENTFSG